MAGFALDSHGSSGSKPGLEALRAAEFKVASGMDSLRKSAANVVSSFERIADSAAATANATAAAASRAATEKAPTATSSSSSVSVGGSGDSSGLQAGLSQVGGQVAYLAAQMRTALASGLSPLTTIAGTMESQLNRLGGTLTELAKRIDSAMKAPARNKALAEQIEAIGLAAKATQSPAAKLFLVLDEGAFRAYRGIRNLNDSMSSMGDVSKKSLDKVGKYNFAKTITGVNATAGALKGVATNAQVAASGIRTIGAEVLVALGAFGLIYKTVQFFGKGIKGAIDLGETLNVTKETFGKFASEVESKADALKDFGFRKGPILDAANAFGALAQGAKMTEEQSARLAATYVQLAADATSYKNVGLDVAAQKIQAGLSGESKPLKDWGILINEDLVKVRAFTLGLTKGKGDISEYAKMMARASLISEQMGKASGDLQRTQESTANQFRKAGGGLDNFAVSIGELLVPAVQTGVIAFNELLASLVEVFEDNKSMVSTWAASVAAAVDAAGSGIRNFAAYWQIAQLSATQVCANILLALDTLPPNFAKITQWLSENWKELWVDWMTIEMTFLKNMGTNAANFGMAFWDAIKGKGFDFEWTPLLEGFKATAAKFPELMKPVWADMSAEINEQFNKINAKEEARKKNVASYGQRSKAIVDADLPGKDKKGHKVHDYAGGADFGTKESYAEVLKLYGGGKGDNKLEKVANKQLNVLQQIQKQGIKSNDASRKLDIVTA
jgi:hypothetical protein